MSRVLEQGDVLFYYRPRVSVDEVRRLEDVQRFFFEASYELLDHEGGEVGLIGAAEDAKAELGIELDPET